MESAELLSTLTTKVRELSLRERLCIYTVFLEELSIEEVALNAEVHRRLDCILSALRSVPPLEGISWVMEQLSTSREESTILQGQILSEIFFEEEG